MSARRLLACGLLAFVGVTAWAQESSRVEDRPLVGAVELRSDLSNLDVDLVFAAIETRPGRPLREDEVATTLEQVSALGFGDRVEVLLSPSRDVALEGRRVVDVVVVLWGDVTVTELALEGELGLPRSRLRPLIDQDLGATLSEDRLLRGVYRLQNELASAGFRQALVRLEVDVDERRKIASVIYRVSSGEPAEVVAVEMVGEIGSFSASELREPLRQLPGARESVRTLEDDVERLERWLFDRGYLRAEIEDPAVVYDEDTNGVRIEHRLRVGPEIVLEVRGVDRARFEKTGLLRFLGEAGYDSALLASAEERIRRDFQERGHWLVRVDSEETTDRGSVQGRERIVVVFEIHPGARFRLIDLVFEGNESFSAERLLELFSTQERALLGLSGGSLVEQSLEEDLSNLRSFYALEGFGDAQVGPPRVEVLMDTHGTAASGGGERGGRRWVELAGADEAETSWSGGRFPRESIPLRVVVPIAEGPRTRVASFEISGMTALTREDLGPLPLEVAGPFHPRRVEQVVEQVRSRYQQLGYERVEVDAFSHPSADGLVVDVEVDVREGPRSVVDLIVVRGNLRTREELVRSAIGLESGDAVSRAKMVEAERRLYQLGIFSSVEIEATSIDRHLEASGEVERTIFVRVEEGRRFRTGYGVGYDSEDGARGLFNVTWNNFRGRGGVLRLDLRVSQREERYRLLYSDRSFRGGRIPVSYSLYRTSEELSEFDSERQGVQVEASRWLGDVRASLFLDYRRVDLAARSAAGRQALESPLPDVDRELLEARVTSLTGTLLVDQRDDPFDPSRGWGGLLQVEQAFPLLDTEERFLKVFAQATGYLSLSRGAEVVLAASGRLGAIEADPDFFGSGEVDEVPVAERFFAGGRTTHRAFRRDGLGIEGETLVDGVAIGGQGLVLGNLDLRFPIFGDLGGVVFVDVGNVYADWREVDFGEVRLGAGLGVRYRSPVGPIRLEVGWKLDREQGEDGSVVLFSFGNPF